MRVQLDKDEKGMETLHGLANGGSKYATVPVAHIDDAIMMLTQFMKGMVLEAHHAQAMKNCAENLRKSRA